MKSKMSEQARLNRNAYHRAWTKQNPIKVQKINERFYRKKAEQLSRIEKLDIQKGTD